MKNVVNFAFNWIMLLTSPIWIIPTCACLMLKEKAFKKHMITGDKQFFE
jgi:hypothetical protein